MDPNDIRGECWELPFWNSGDKERARPEKGEGVRLVLHDNNPVVHSIFFTDSVE